MAGQPVGPDAGDEDQQREREGLRGEHEAELAGAPVELVEDGEGERDREQRVADERDRLAGQQQAQRADPEGGQRVGEAGGGHRRGEATDAARPRQGRQHHPVDACMTHAHEVNALGALALEVARRVQEAGEAASPHGASVPPP